MELSREQEDLVVRFKVVQVIQEKLSNGRTKCWKPKSTVLFSSATSKLVMGRTFL